MVVMTRAFQEATGFKLGDTVRISLGDGIPDAEEVLVQEIDGAAGGKLEAKHPACWEFSVSLSLGKWSW